MDRDAMKSVAAVAAVDEIESGMVVGLGTGSTAAHAVREVGRRLATGRLERISAIPTSLETEKLAAEVLIPLIEPGTYPIDVAIDGADEIAPDLALTKGGGGALLREKVIAAAARRFVVIADDSKLVAALGSSFDIPIEVARYGLRITTNELERLGRPGLRSNEHGPFVTDNGNHIIDLAVDPIEDPTALEASLQAIPGVLATGLFIGIADVAYVAGPGGIRRIEAASPANIEGV